MRVYLGQKGRMMATVKPQEISKEARWRVIATLAFVIAAIFFWPFLGVICLAAITAFLFHPLYLWFHKYIPSIAAASATVVTSILIVVIPIIIVMAIAITQGLNLVDNLAGTSPVEPTTSTQDNVEVVVREVNEIIGAIGSGQFHVDSQSIQTFLSSTLPTLIQSFLTIIIGFASSIPALITTVTVYLFLFSAFVINGRKILNDVHQLSPFDGIVTKLYLQRTGGMIKASMLSQLLIAFVLSVLTALLLIPVGGGPYFFFLVIVMTFLNMIPLGSGLLVYPLAIIIMLLGNVSGGAWVIIIYSFVICSLDNVMRPRLIPKSVQLAPALMTLSVFCGIQYFGFLGVVYGPVVAILLFTTYEIYLEHRQLRSGKKVNNGGIA